MKKLYVSLLACSALLTANNSIAQESAYTLTEDWHVVTRDPGGNVLEGLDRNRDWSAENVTGKNCVRFATAMDGKIYLLNMMTMSIAEFTPEGEIKDVYKLPALEGDDFYGTSITRDDAGNFLIGHYFTAQKSSYVWTIYQPSTGKYKHFDVSPAVMPSNGRIDCVGRVIGDLTKDAWLYVASTKFNSVNPNIDPAEVKDYIINFFGDGNVESVSADGEFSPQVYISNGCVSVCQPRFASIDEMNAFLDGNGNIYDTFFSYSNGYGGTVSLDDHWPMFYVFNDGKLTSLAGHSDNHFKSYPANSGFDTFVLGGKRFYVINYLAYEDADGFANNRAPHDIAVYDEEFNQVAVWKDPDWYSNASYASIIADPVDENTVNIYSYVCAGGFKNEKYGNSAIAGAKLTFTAGSTSGIEDVAVDTDAAPVYYNLQGIEVENPVNGVYIVKRGNKTTKELVR